MAVTISAVREAHRETYTITFTADGDAVLQLPDRAIEGITIHSNGVDGGGTLTAFVSNLDADYTALGVATPTAPLTVVTFSLTAAGNVQMFKDTLGYQFLKFTLASSTSPTLVVTVSVMFGF